MSIFSEYICRPAQSEFNLNSWQNVWYVNLSKQHPFTGYLLGYKSRKIYRESLHQTREADTCSNFEPTLGDFMFHVSCSIKVGKKLGNSFRNTLTYHTCSHAVTVCCANSPTALITDVNVRAVFQR